MTKRIAAVLMAVLVVSSFQAGVCMKDGGVYGGEKEEIGIIVDGTKLSFSQDDGMGVPFIDSAGRVQTPIRKVLEKIGAAVSFETDAGSGEKNITVSKDGSVIGITAGESAHEGEYRYNLPDGYFTADH